jgi:hypothetical protein
MAETTADVRRDIELTRERMSSTLNQLERKLNVSQIVKDNPWPAVGVAFGAGAPAQRHPVGREGRRRDPHGHQGRELAPRPASTTWSPG